MKTSQKQILRVIDANYNRAKEGIRVCEDVARFVLGATRLTGLYKKCRHDLTRILLGLPVSYRQMVAERNVTEDVGRSSLKLDKKKIQIQDIFDPI